MGLVIPTAIGALALLLLYHHVLHPALISPLRKLPAAHWTCHFSSTWILAARLYRRENRSLHEAHIKLGPVVRIGPVEVSVDGVEGMRVIYQGGFEKGFWYSVFSNYGVPNMFSTGSSNHHSARKRMVANVYSKSYLQSSQASKAQISHIVFQRLLPALGHPQGGNNAETVDQGDPASHKDVEVFGLFLALAMDVITAYLFGLSNGTDFIQDEKYRQSWQEMYLARANYPFWTQEVPNLTAACARWLPWLRLYPKWVDESNAKLSQWNLNLCQGVTKAEQDATKGRPRQGKASTEPCEEPVVFNALQYGIDRELRTNGEKSILYKTSICERELAVASELMDHSLAGHETTGMVLTYATWHLSRSPDLQEQLRSEILSIGSSLKLFQSSSAEAHDSGNTMSDSSLPDLKALDALPLLNAIVMETLRLHAPIPGPQPRDTPKDGCSIAGYHIPGGVRIASMAYSLHRDPNVFPQPESWKPERWLPEDGKDTGTSHREMHRQFWAFGSGGRMCVGSNFALNEMKVILAAIYANFKTTVVNDDGIEQEDAYTARPVGEQLVLRFQPLDI
ncbi:hypothetical protein CEP54_009700 [Fusarium duplospermum]|uniref:Cytochrome P450 monooxygenase n=1 Tax=Fusarium duplospermum TaxID=1325734 RepID=A0A428PP76_9HYPO|nr:hypothetical protein CEP54_009700 [Fusarium duplospermum]